MSSTQDKLDAIEDDLLQVLRHLAATEVVMQGSGELLGRVVQVSRALVLVRQLSQDDTGSVLRAMHKFAGYVIATFPEDTANPVREAVRAFVEALSGQ